MAENEGFTYITQHYRKINNPSFWIQNAIKKFEKKHPDKPHPYPLYEDILVFKKELQKTQREREQLLTPLPSVHPSPTNSAKEQTPINSEAKETGEPMQSTQTILTT